MNIRVYYKKSKNTPKERAFMKTGTVLGSRPMTFPWGFDEEADSCRSLKLEMLQQIMVLRQAGVTCWHIVPDCGVGLYAAEMLLLLGRKDPELTLYCVIPYEEQAAKWAPYLRERYFDVLSGCAAVEPVSLRKTDTCVADAYHYAVQKADTVLFVSSGAPCADSAIFRGKDVICIDALTGKTHIRV